MDLVHAALRDENLEPKLQTIFKKSAQKTGNDDSIKNYKMSFQTF